MLVTQLKPLLSKLNLIENIQNIKREFNLEVNIMLMSPYADDVAKVIVEEGVKVVTTGAGSPEKYMKMWKEAGVKVIPVIASVALAKRMERCGADALVAEGTEAGGHIGENTTMVLVPQVVDAVNVPVIAAGGIADGRGIAAAFMLGAQGVQMGTHFVVTNESQVHENYKDMIIKARDIDSRVTGRSTGHPVRALRNQMTKEYLKKEQEGAPFEELELLTLGGLRRAVVDGEVVAGVHEVAGNARAHDAGADESDLLLGMCHELAPYAGPPPPWVPKEWNVREAPLRPRRGRGGR